MSLPHPDWDAQHKQQPLCTLHCNPHLLPADVKRIKTEAGWEAAGVKAEVGVQAAALLPKEEPAAAAAAADVDATWHQAQQAAGDGVDEWEDVEGGAGQQQGQQEQDGGGEGGAGAAAGVAATLDDEFKWEDA